MAIWKFFVRSRPLDKDKELVRATSDAEALSTGGPGAPTKPGSPLRFQLALSTAQCAFVIGSVLLKRGIARVDREGGEVFHPVVFAFGREAAAAPILYGAGLWLSKGRVAPNRADLPAVAALGFFLYLSQLMYIAGIELSGVVVATCIQPVIPVLTVLLSVFLGAEKAKPAKLGGIALSVAGALCMVIGGMGGGHEGGGKTASGKVAAAGILRLGRGLRDATAGGALGGAPAALARAGRSLLAADPGAAASAVLTASAAATGSGVAAGAAGVAAAKGAASELSGRAVSKLVGSVAQSAVIGPAWRRSMAAGNTCLAFNTLGMACYYIVGKKVVSRYHAVSVASWAYVVGATLMGATAASVAPSVAWRIPGSVMWPLIYWVLVCSVGGYALVTTAMQHLPASQVAAFQCLQPFLGTALAFFVLGERPSPWDLGAVGVLAGLALVAREKDGPGEPASHLPASGPSSASLLGASPPKPPAPAPAAPPLSQGGDAPGGVAKGTFRRVQRSRSAASLLPTTRAGHSQAAVQLAATRSPGPRGGVAND